MLSDKEKAYQKEYHKQYRIKNADKLRLKKQEYTQKNKEEIYKKHKEYVEKNKEKVSERRKAHYQKNKDRINAQILDWCANNREKSRTIKQKYRLANPEKMKEKYHAYKPRRNERKIERKKTDIQYKLSIAIRERMRMAIKHGKGKKHTRSLELLGCSLEEARLHLEKQFKEGMTWDNHTLDGWHIDHIKPCASFDLTVLEEQKKCFHYTNLQPLWAEENLSKGYRV